MKVRYLVYNKDFEEKRYRYKIQALLYCLFSGYLFTQGHIIHPDIKIEKIVSLGDFLKKFKIKRQDTR